MIGCKSNNNNLRGVLIASDCYWDIHNNYSTVNQRISYCYKFKKNGSCSYLFTPDKEGKRDEFNFDDNKPITKKWEVHGDTIIYILGIERRVINFSKDTILLSNPIGNEKDTLIRNCR